MRAYSPRFTPQQDAALIKAYVEDDMTSVEIAAAWKVERRTISRKVTRLGLWARLTPEQQARRSTDKTRDMAAKGLLARAELGQFIWTAERLAVLRRLYVDELASASTIARAVGARPHDVSRKAHQLGLAALRPAGVRQAERSAAQGLGRQSRRERREERAGQVISDADLIAEAVAAGRVTRLPSGHAAGITRWERLLSTAPPPRPDAQALDRARKAGVAAHARRMALAGASA
ncbi:hypothetical protein [Caulobacter sp. DWR3-1-2]|uniref:hypothetical protein n=1 Tax=Caulobacter sp. DWR3-1-2 TaxID=2804647 RepID=UPI003CF232EA